jgi:signal transduction histidine kinase
MPGDDELAGHPAVVRVARAGQRLRRFDAEHPWFLDVAVVALVYLLAGAPDLIHGRPPDAATFLAMPPRPEVIALQAGLVLPLLWRRRAPTATFYVVATVFVVQGMLGVGLRADIALLIAVYNLALREGLRRLAWAAAALVGAVGLVVARIAPLTVLVDALFLALSAVTAAATLAVAVRLRRAQLESLKVRAAELEAERDQRSRLAAATERTRIAREMHDILGHNLSVMITLADGGASASTVEAARGTQALHLIGDVGRRTLGDLRRVLDILRGPDEGADRAPQPDIAAIGPLCEQIRAAGPAVTYRTTGDLDTLDPGLQLATYRIAQEALTNSLRHAGSSTRIELALELDPGGLRIAVRDSGPAGPHPPPTTPHNGQGLIGIRERVAAYHGTATAGPDPRGGWIVTATLRPAALPTGDRG